MTTQTLAPPSALSNGIVLDDARITSMLAKIQSMCRPVPAVDLMPTSVKGSTAKIVIHHVRPRSIVNDTLVVDHVRYVEWKSLIDGEPNLRMPVREYEEHLGGKKFAKHMPFVQQDTIDLIVNLLKGFTFYRDSCEYPGCPCDFESGLAKKAELLVRGLFDPPGSEPSGDRPVMELKRQCEMHFILGEMRGVITALLFGLNVKIQELPEDEREAAMAKGFAKIVDLVWEAVKVLCLEKGMKVPTKKMMHEVLAAFVTEASGGAA